MRLVFVTWDGPGTAYHENLFIPLLEAAVESSDEVELLQFHWNSAERSARIESLASDRGMSYEGIDVRRFGRVGVPLAVASGAWRLRRLSKQGRCDLLLVRSIIPGAMTLAAFIGLRGSDRPAFVYDADGLPADERADFAGWSRRGPRYRLFRAIERSAIRTADAVLTRTNAAAQILDTRTGRTASDFFVVTNGRIAPDVRLLEDPSRAQIRSSLGVPEGAPLLVYAGSVGLQYLPHQMMQIAAEVISRHPDAHLAVFASAAHHGHLHELAARHRVSNVVIRSLAPGDVAAHLAAGDVGLALRAPTLSQQAVAPVKIAEYLLSGLPVVYTRGVGDLDDQMDTTVSHGIAPTDGIVDAADWISGVALSRRSDLRPAARSFGERAFSLDRGAANYRDAIDHALQSGGRPSAERKGPSHRS